MWDFLWSGPWLWLDAQSHFTYFGLYAFASYHFCFWNILQAHPLGHFLFSFPIFSPGKSYLMSAWSPSHCSWGPCLLTITNTTCFKYSFASLPVFGTLAGLTLTFQKAHVWHWFLWPFLSCCSCACVGHSLPQSAPRSLYALSCWRCLLLLPFSGWN